MPSFFVCLCTFFLLDAFWDCKIFLNYHNNLIYITTHLNKIYLSVGSTDVFSPSATSKMEIFAKIANGRKQLNIFAESSISDVQLGSKSAPKEAFFLNLPHINPLRKLFSADSVIHSLYIGQIEIDNTFFYVTNSYDHDAISTFNNSFN